MVWVRIFVKWSRLVGTGHSFNCWLYMNNRLRRWERWRISNGGFPFHRKLMELFWLECFLEMWVAGFHVFSTKLLPLKPFKTVSLKLMARIHYFTLCPLKYSCAFLREFKQNVGLSSLVGLTSLWRSVFGVRWMKSSFILIEGMGWACIPYRISFSR